MLQHQQLAAILPIHPVHRDRLDLYRAALLIHSMAASGTLRSITELLVIVPDTTVAAAGSLEDLVGGQTRFRVVPESEIFSATEVAAMKEISGWYRQQLIKLAAPRITPCEALLMLDSDMFNLRRLDLAELAPDGRLPTQFGTQFPAWKEASAQVLETTVPANSMSVTPAFLDRAILVRLHEYLAGPAGNWIEALCTFAKARITWTEYMLYQCAGEKFGMFADRHAESTIRLHTGLWAKTKATPEFFASLQKNLPLFMIVQSLRNDFDAVQAMLHADGLPSVYALRSADLARIARSLDDHVRRPNTLAKHAPLRRALERAIVALPPGRRTWSDLDTAVGAMVAGGEFGENATIATFQAATAAADTEKLATLLLGCTSGDRVAPELIEFYHEVLLERGSHFVCVTDVLQRLSRDTLQYGTLRLASLGLIARGERSWVARILLAARRRFPRRKILDLCAEARAVARGAQAPGAPPTP